MLPLAADGEWMSRYLATNCSGGGINSGHPLVIQR